MASKIYHLVKIHFKAPLHLSRGQTDEYDYSEEILHSDTIKSAIFVAAKMLFGDDTNESFFDSFKVSSAFPYSGNEFFFPKPMVKLNLDFTGRELGVSKKNKILKKLSYISSDIFEKLIQGNKIEVTDSQLSDDGKFLFVKNPVKVFSSEVQQRLAMPEGGEKDGTPYYIERIYFTAESGLYFLIDFNEDDNTFQKIKAALKLLGDEGVGTDKHVGNGTFNSECTEITLNIPHDADSQLTLSLYCPGKDEIRKDLLEKSSWQLIKRGGYIASPENMDFLTFRKKSIYMFSESSVFPAEINIKGKKVDLKPENIKGLTHPVWRDGTVFSVPIKQNEND